MNMTATRGENLIKNELARQKNNYKLKSSIADCHIRGVLYKGQFFIFEEKSLFACELSRWLYKTLILTQIMEYY